MVNVVNKGLNMTKGKMAAQVAHASEAFLTKEFLINPELTKQEIGYKYATEADFNKFVTGED